MYTRKFSVRREGHADPVPIPSPPIPARLFPNSSRLGMGCASLGSRISTTAGLLGLEEAFESGINWLDLSPSYGDGEAEVIVGRFARSRRDRVHICTKVGMAPPPLHPLMRVIRPFAQRLVAHIPSARAMAARGRPAPQRLALDGRLILSSLENSLRRLGTDHVDVLAVHYAEIDDISREDVLRALETVVTSGMARAVGVAGSPLVARVVLEQGRLWHVQFAAGSFARNLAEMASVIAAGRSVAVHSVFSGLAAMQSQFRTCRRATESVLARHPYGMNLDTALRSAMLDLALAIASSGVVVVSAFAPSHLAFAVERLKRHDGIKAAALLHDLKRLLPEETGSPSPHPGGWAALAMVCSIV